MKKYLVTIIPFILGVICFISYNIIGSEVTPDGILVEPFGLIPTGFLLISISIIIASIMSTWGLFHNPKKIDKIAFAVSIILILLSASYLFLVSSYCKSLDAQSISMISRNIIN